jgi:hypothetical protein
MQPGNYPVGNRLPVLFQHHAHLQNRYRSIDFNKRFTRKPASGWFVLLLGHGQFHAQHCKNHSKGALQTNNPLGGFRNISPDAVG